MEVQWKVLRLEKICAIREGCVYRIVCLERIDCIEKAKEFFQQNESWLGDIIRKESRKDPEFKEWLRSRDIRSTLPATLSGFEVLTRSDSEDSPSSS